MKHLELIEGEIIEIVSSSANNAMIALHIGRLLDAYIEQHANGSDDIGMIQSAQRLASRLKRVIISGVAMSFHSSLIATACPVRVPTAL